MGFEGFKPQRIDKDQTDSPSELETVLSALEAKSKSEGEVSFDEDGTISYTEEQHEQLKSVLAKYKDQ